MGVNERLIIVSRKILSDWDKNVTCMLPVFIEELRQAVAEFDELVEYYERQQ